jgi:hypothetical protein
MIIVCIFGGRRVPDWSQVPDFRNTGRPQILGLSESLSVDFKPDVCLVHQATFHHIVNELVVIVEMHRFADPADHLATYNNLITINKKPHTKAGKGCAHSNACVNVRAHGNHTVFIINVGKLYFDLVLFPLKLQSAIYSFHCLSESRLLERQED